MVIKISITKFIEKEHGKFKQYIKRNYKSFR